MNATEVAVVLVGDLRSFAEGRRALVARTNAAGVDVSWGGAERGPAALTCG